MNIPHQRKLELYKLRLTEHLLAGDSRYKREQHRLRWKTAQSALGFGTARPESKKGERNLEV